MSNNAVADLKKFEREICINTTEPITFQRGSNLSVEVGVKERNAEFDVEENPLQLRRAPRLLPEVEAQYAPVASAARDGAVDGVHLLLKQSLRVNVPHSLKMRVGGQIIKIN